eukprot:maker-scaffold1592_size34625-snap-gene-0.6 protein:Tk01211 transcript:maker-scaffold1592_size34625-snap-gene-0.6-mRNA-1 annotation:"PREDICTED: bestrophin-1-like"
MENIYLNRYKATNQRLNGIFHLLLVWRGSIFKLIWHDVIVFTVCYFSLSLLYRTVLIHYPVQRELFELICIYAGRYSAVIPISFLTGFFVTQVVNRWWDQFMSLPWPDKIALKLVSFVPGKDHFRKNLRRTVMRYVNLSTILVYRLVSLKAKKRFSTYQDLVDAKLMLPHEVERMRKADERTPHEFTWLPILWAMKLLQRARTEGKITIEPPVFTSLINSFDYIITCNRKILNYGWVNFPLAYTQVASVSVFLYFLAALFGRQYLIPHDKGVNGEISTAAEQPSFFHNLGIISFTTEKPFDKHSPDFFIPIFTFVELISYLGWIKVAECLLNPFGDDDEDFKVNYMIDRNLQVSYLIVDEAEEDLEIAEDPFTEAGISIPADLPYKDKNAKPSIENATTKTTLGPVNSIRSGLAQSSAIMNQFRDSMRSGISEISTESKEAKQPLTNSTMRMTSMLADQTQTNDTLYVSVADMETSVELDDTVPTSSKTEPERLNSTTVSREDETHQRGPQV